MGVDGVRRVDWHDYDSIRRDAARVGGYKLFAAQSSMCTEKQQQQNNVTPPPSLSMGFLIRTAVNQTARVQNET